MPADKIFDSFLSGFEKVNAELSDKKRKGGSVPLPAVNEMRYAGRHFTNALEMFLCGRRGESEWVDNKCVAEECRRAASHVRRANDDLPEYEQVKAILLQEKYLRECENDLHIIQSIDDFGDHLKKRNIRLLSLTKSEEFFKKSVSYIQMRQEYTASATAFNEAYEKADSMLNKGDSSVKRSNVLRRVRACLTLGVGIISNLILIAVEPQDGSNKWILLSILLLLITILVAWAWCWREQD